MSHLGHPRADLPPPRPPVEPPPSRWSFPPATSADEHGVVGMGADLSPGTLLAAYRAGLFPMPVGRSRLTRRLAWWSPDPRGVLPLDGLRVPRSLRKACARFDVRVDTSFEAVVDACADPSRDGAWITAEIRNAYVMLHRLGWAHSVEAWSLDDGRLAGGLYGVAIGGLFAGESMFHRRTDASKVALVGLVEVLSGDGQDRLLDVQWRTEHLASLGVVDLPRDEYLERLAAALLLPLPEEFGG
jgi:leucyl/phenylalanyl-tRNA--protein transferase